MLTRAELKAIANGLIAMCQWNGDLPTSCDELADALQELASNEVYIAKQDLIDWLEG